MSSGASSKMKKKRTKRVSGRRYWCLLHEAHIPYYLIKKGKIKWKKGRMSNKDLTEYVPCIAFHAKHYLRPCDAQMWILMRPLKLLCVNFNHCNLSSDFSSLTCPVTLCSGDSKGPEWLLCFAMECGDSGLARLGLNANRAAILLRVEPGDTTRSKIHPLFHPGKVDAPRIDETH